MLALIIVIIVEIDIEIEINQNRAPFAYVTALSPVSHGTKPSS